MAAKNLWAIIAWNADGMQAKNSYGVFLKYERPRVVFSPIVDSTIGDGFSIVCIGHAERASKLQCANIIGVLACFVVAFAIARVIGANIAPLYFLASFGAYGGKFARYHSRGIVAVSHFSP